MKLALSKQIHDIDLFCADVLGLTTLTLMKKSGDAVANVIRERVPHGASVAFLAGKGNNGGDAYAAACNLFSDYDVTVYDIFSAGQRTEEGKHFLGEFKRMGGEIKNYDFSVQMLSDIKKSKVIVDAVFGTGLEGEIPEELRSLSVGIREAVGDLKVAIDVPLGINADNGSVSEFAVSVDVTVELSYIKPGIVSYPAKSYVGEIVHDTLGLPMDKIEDRFDFPYTMTTVSDVKAMIPERESNSNKSTFGKALLIVGSEKYRGAAHLASEAALRGGAGYVSYFGEELIADELRLKYPEIIYKTTAPIKNITSSEINEAVELSRVNSATLIGSGSDNTDGLAALTKALLASEGGTLVLDADAINALSGLGEEGRAALKNAKRSVILTPHPLEFARLAGIEVAEVQQNRISLAKSFAHEYGVTLILKGAGTIITDGDKVTINSLGSSALAKAGSGDVLAGLLVSIAAGKALTPFDSARLSTALHAMAGDRLAKEFSTYGVTPSDLPKEIARILASMK